jgi:predicted DCC family thiol-disulfide oxidoreductase YuxK
MEKISSQSIIKEDSSHSLVLFDGVCNLCNTFVDFIIRRDPEGVYRFASLQSDLGQEKITRCQIKETNSDSVILIESGKCFIKSTAALRIIRHLRSPWPMWYVFIIIPRMLRDPIYDYVARNRYQWFGKRDTCRLPTLEERSRFLD